MGKLNQIPNGASNVTWNFPPPTSDRYDMGKGVGCVRHKGSDDLGLQNVFFEGVGTFVLLLNSSFLRHKLLAFPFGLVSNVGFSSCISRTMGFEILLRFKYRKVSRFDPDTQYCTQVHVP